MILQALYDYYNRCKDCGEEIPAVGYRLRKIAFNIVIKEDGSFVRVEDNRTFDDKRKITVPRREVVREKPRTSNVEALFLWDKAEYLLNVSGGKLANSYTKKCKKFIEGCQGLAHKYPNEKLINAIVFFYNKMQLSEVAKTDEWKEMLSDGKYYFSFKLQGDTFSAGEIKYLTEDVKTYDLGDSTAEKRCLVTGTKCQSIRIWLSVALPKCGTTKPRLISFQEGQGYDSYGQEQGDNAPVGWEVAEKISIALERLLDGERKQQNYFTIGNRTFLFWAASNSEKAKAVEEGLFSFFGQTDDKDEDDPNRRLKTIQATFESIYNGKKTDSDDRFYILGLAPNSARITVVYWNETTVRDFAGMILQHFNDMEIVDGRKDKQPYCGLYQMMKSVTLKGDISKNLQPNLPEATIKSILQGLPYPYTLFASAIRRIRAEQADSMQIARLAIIKAHLNRTNNNKRITNMLDKENNNLGYVCGRLFAVLEYSQKRANNITTIKERYMNSASATPAAVFATLLNLNVHHVEKLDNASARIYIENMKQEIVALLPADGFPSHLDLQDQGRFFVGYYHQMQDIYTKKENNQD